MLRPTLPGPRTVLAAACTVFLVLPGADPVSAGGLLTLAGAAAAAWTVLRPGSLGPLVLLGVGVLLWVSLVEDPGPAHAVAFGAAGYAVHAVASLTAAIPAGVRLDAATWWTAIWRGALGVGIGVAAVAAGSRLAEPAASSILVGAGLLMATAVVTLPRLVTRWSRL